MAAEQPKEVQQPQEQQEKKQVLPPVVLLKTPELVQGENYTIMPMHQSQDCYHKGIKYTDIEQLDESLAEQTVTVRARVQNVRGKGNMVFLFLRKGIYTAQALVCKSETVTKEFVQFAQKLTNESICDITGVVKTVPKPIEKATQHNVEIHVTNIAVISLAQYPLPMQIEDLTFPSSVFKKFFMCVASVDFFNCFIVDSLHSQLYSKFCSGVYFAKKLQDIIRKTVSPCSYGNS